MTLLMVFMTDGFCVIRARAAQGAVTSVSLTQDVQGAAGETVLASPLCRTDGGQLLLSYISGDGVPVTGLVVGYRNEESVTVNGAVYNNSTGGIYLYWQRAAATGIGGQVSAISGGTLALSAGGGFLAGGAIGACVLSAVKKKKQTAE